MSRYTKVKQDARSKATPFSNEDDMRMLNPYVMEQYEWTIWAEAFLEKCEELLETHTDKLTEDHYIW